MKPAVYFDLDNTLVNRNKSIERFAHCFVKYFLNQLPEINTDEVSQLIKFQDNGGYLVKKSKYQSISQAISVELFQLFKCCQNVKVEDIELYWRSEFPVCTVEMSGARELIFELDSLGIHLGVISNGGQASRERTLASTSFGHLFKQVVSSEQFGVAKPSGSIFIETAKAAGFVPSECLYVGDHPVSDILAASKIGMDVIWLQGFHADICLPNSVIKVTNCKEIIKLFVR